MSKIESSPPPQMNPPVRREPRPPSVSGLFLAALRENWRRLRTMRTALWILGILSVESIIATIVPQEINVPQTVADWRSGEAGPGEAGASGIDVYLSLPPQSLIFRQAGGAVEAVVRWAVAVEGPDGRPLTLDPAD